MINEKYVADLEKRIEELERLLEDDCVVADEVLEKARRRVQYSYLSRKDTSSFNTSFSISPGWGIHISVLFRGEEDYSINVPWKHCQTNETINTYLDKILKEVGTTDEDGFVIREF